MMSTIGLRVRDWDQWQTFRKDRGTPPWIKVYRQLLTSAKWAALTDAEKGQLISMWIVAAERDGNLPGDANILRKVCLLDDSPNIPKFISLGFLESAGCQVDNQVTTKWQPDGCQDDAPETETLHYITEDKNTYGSSDDEPPRKKPAKPKGYSDDFERLWLKRPKRSGSDPKNSAFKAFNARLKNGHTVTEIEAGVERYTAYLKATGKLNTEYVQQFSTFLGPDEHFLDPWTIPAKQPSQMTVGERNRLAIEEAMQNARARQPQFSGELE